MYDLLKQLQEQLLTDIPLTRALGVTVDNYTQGQLSLCAPLATNINHKQTAFAGSLNALLTLTCWGQLWLILQEQKQAGKIVLQDCSCRYLKPVTTDFTARCQRPSQTSIARLTRTLQAKGKARIELEATISEHDQVAASFTGRYVVLLPPDTSIEPDVQIAISLL